MIFLARKSLKFKAFVSLISLCIVPFLVLGITINLFVTENLEKKLNFMANQAIEKLALSIARDVQSYMDLALYLSKNQHLTDIITSLQGEEENNRDNHYKIKGEIYQSDLISRLNYPYNYLIIMKDGSVFTNHVNTTINQKIRSEKWFEMLKNSHSNSMWIGTRPNYFFQNEGDQTYIACSMVKDFENVGILIISFSKYYIEKVLGNSKISQKSSLYIIGQGGDNLFEAYSNYYSFDKLPKAFVSDLNLEKISQNSMKISGHRQMVIHKKILFKGINDVWEIVLVTPIDDINKDIKKLSNTIFIIMLLSISTVIIMVYIINRQILNPIVNLSKLMMEVKSGNLEVYAEENRTDEIGLLGSGFNSMVLSIKKYISSIKKEEEEKRELEIRMLQSQINPHFLSNTLNIIRWMAEIKKATGISRSITSFIRLLDYSFKGVCTMVTIREEIEYLKEYIFIQNLRYQNKFIVNINVDEEIMNCRILKLTFQPIVENSIIHGLESKKGQGNINISGYREGNNLIFVIRDDGAGMNASTLENVFKNRNDSFAKNQQGSGSIGLINIQRRIKLNFGDNYGVSIKSELGEGTQTTILFPVIRDNKDGVENENSDC